MAGWNEIHPALNAGLNATSAIFLVLGRVAIAGGDRDRHRTCMLIAFGASVTFLVSYVARFYISGTHVYPAGGWIFSRSAATCSTDSSFEMPSWTTT